MSAPCGMGHVDRSLGSCCRALFPTRSILIYVSAANSGTLFETNVALLRFVLLFQHGCHFLKATHLPFGLLVDADQCIFVLPGSHQTSSSSGSVIASFDFTRDDRENLDNRQHLRIGHNFKTSLRSDHLLLFHRLNFHKKWTSSNELFPPHSDAQK